MTSKFRYLGPSDFISPGAGQPYVAKGEEVELEDAQVDQLLMLGHRFEGEETPTPADVPTDPRERVAMQERANADTPESKKAAKAAPQKAAAPAAS